MDGNRSEKPNLIGISGKIGHGKDLVGNIIRYLNQQKRIQEEHTWENWVTWTYKDDLYYEDDFIIKKFADKLKDITCMLIGCTREQLEDREFKGSTLGDEWTKYGIVRELGTRLIDIQGTEEEAKERLSHWGKKCKVQKVQMTPRLFMQLLGTEAGREILHPNIWVNALFADYKPEGNLEATLNEKGELSMYASGTPGITMPNWLITDVRFPNEAQAVKDHGGILIRVNRDTYPETLVHCKGPEDCEEVKFDKNNKSHMDWYKGDKLKKAKSEHPSETGLDSYEGFDHIIENDGTIEDLVVKVKRLNLV